MKTRILTLCTALGLFAAIVATAQARAPKSAVVTLEKTSLGTTKRKDGKLEVTYGGHPLYRFVSDRHPGQTTGQGVNQFGGPWWVLSAAGKEIHRG